MSSDDRVYLGFDFSTQQLKGVILNEDLDLLHQAHVQFDNDLPEFRTHKGVVKGEKKSVTSPVLMWVKALDMILEKLRVCGADFSKVCAVSASAQQHGTVYWAIGSNEVLKSLTDEHFLHTQLASCFSVTSSPVWMDSSTTKQCKALEEAIGGPTELAKLTGSKAYERFSASQITKIYETKPTAYKNTERISLISSFVCSLFLGQYAPIDYADGSGMNLLDIRAKTWSKPCLDAVAPDLESKLGPAVPSNSVLGKISSYFVERFGFSEQCDVVACTGDNPSSLAGMGLCEHDLAVSLGTSDTLFLWLKEPLLLEEGHLLVNPLSESEYMALLCYKNGSISRERFKDIYASGNWDEFNKLLESTPRGNFGYIGLFYDLEEILIPIQGEFRYDKADNSIEKFPSAEIEVRALLEGQFLVKRSLIEDLGIAINEKTRIVATGGASQNSAILQVISDVFNTPVYTLECANSAVIGAAYRAFDAVSRHTENGGPKAIRPKLNLVCTPFSDSKQVYDPMVERCKTIVKKLIPS